MAKLTFYASAGDAAHGIPMYDLTLPAWEALAALENSGFIPEGGGVYTHVWDGSVAVIESVKEV